MSHSIPGDSPRSYNFQSGTFSEAFELISDVFEKAGFSLGENEVEIFGIFLIDDPEGRLNQVFASWGVLIEKKIFL